MERTLSPLTFIIAVVSGWITRQQLEVLEYLREENRVLKRQIGKRRLKLTDEDRRRLAIRGKALGRKALGEFASIVTPDTLLRWHRQLIAAKWTYASKKRRGRPAVMKEIAELAVRMAKENPTWGYRRIQGALAVVGHRVAHNTVKKILREHGIDPAPERSKKTTWSQFLRTHWDVLGGADFFTVEVWMPKGLVTFYVFFVIELRSRAVRILGWTPNPDRLFMRQVALELAEHERPFPTMRRLIIDRDSKYTKEFEEILAEAEIEIVKIPARSPNCNPHAERFVRSAGEECLDRVILFGENSLRRALRQYETHFVRERSHQGIGNRLVSPDPSDSGTGNIECRPRLGGLLRFYRRAAA